MIFQKKFFFSDEYFVSSIEKIDGLVKAKKIHLASKVQWSNQFKQAITTWPEYNNLGATQNQV